MTFWIFLFFSNGYADESVGHVKVEDFPELHKIVKNEVSLSGEQM